MMREQDYMAVFRLIHEAQQPARLTRRDVMLFERRVEAYQQPVVVLKSKHTGTLAEDRQGDIEVCVPTGVHLVVRVQRAADRVRSTRPVRKESFANLSRRTRVVDVAQMYQEIEALGIALDAGRAHGGPIESRAPVAQDGYPGHVG